VLRWRLNLVTVIFATYNGERTLSKVLNAYTKIEFPKNEWKLVIVDNGSEDNSLKIINSFKQKLPITYLFEKRRGKNIALNAGLLEIENGLVVLTDDDVIPSSNWLSELSIAANANPHYTIFGGPILPEWESIPDEWILKWVKLPPVFAILDDIGDEGPIANYLVFGPNMAVRSEIFQSGYKFDETIGPQGSNYAQGSEAELLIRLGQDGFKAWHCKKAIVKHIIRSYQIKKNWILSRAIRFGRGQYRLGVEYPNCRSFFFGMPKSLFYRILRNCYRLGRSYLTGNKEKKFAERWNLNYLIGIGLEARRVHSK
jgi:glycosyltransferase involved in cell wall biosynthesis